MFIYSQDEVYIQNLGIDFILKFNYTDFLNVEYINTELIKDCDVTTLKVTLFQIKFTTIFSF